MKKLIFIPILFLCRPAASALKPDTPTPGSFASAATLTFNGTVNPCRDSLLHVSCGNDAGTFTGANYFGIPMTSQVTNAGGTCAEFTLSNATSTGTHPIIVTNSGALNVICSAISFCGADPVTPIEATANASATSANPSLAVTIKSSGAYVVDSYWNNGTTPNVPPTANSNVIENTTNAGGPSTDIAQYHGPFQNGSYTDSWQEPQSIAWSKCVAVIKPSTGTPTVLTLNPTSITATSATGNGVLLNAGSFTVTASSLCINTGGGPTLSDTCFGPSNAASPYTFNITGLTAGTLYHCAFLAKNSEGTESGADIPFVTARSNGYFVSPGRGVMSTTAGTGIQTIKH